MKYTLKQYTLNVITTLAAPSIDPNTFTFSSIIKMPKTMPTRIASKLVLACLILLPFSGTAKARSGSSGPTTPSPGLHYYYDVPAANPAETIKVDVCVYGGSPAGVAAAVQAAQMGKTVTLAVFRRHVGGMTSGGLTALDVGNPKSVGGISAAFFLKFRELTGLSSGKAEEVFRAMLDKEKVPVLYEHRLKNVVKEGNRITTVVFENGTKIEAKMFIDATYEGDLLARAGVSFTVGREANATYGETLNGFYVPKSHHHIFSWPVDPYRIPGDPQSGLLPGILPGPLPQAGTADKQVQAYCFRMCASDAPDRLPFPKPANFDRDAHLLFLRYINSSKPGFTWNFGYSRSPMKLNVGDCNSAGPVSIDYVGGNWEWPEADYETRERIFQAHVTYQQGLMWLMANDPEMPSSIREEVSKYGLPTNEFQETGGWPHELYVREGRRMVSDYVMTEADSKGQRVAPESVGLASYPVDSHVCSRHVVNGKVIAQGGFFKGVPKPYPISYRSIVPRETECANLLVPFAVSASHVAFGSIRMEPVNMLLGQSAATAAVLSIDEKVSVQKLPYTKLRERLLKDGQKLEWSASPNKSKEETPAATTEEEN
jgi:hypothetical protein